MRKVSQLVFVSLIVFLMFSLCFFIPAIFVPASVGVLAWGYCYCLALMWGLAFLIPGRGISVFLAHAMNREKPDTVMNPVAQWLIGGPLFLFGTFVLLCRSLWIKYGGDCFTGCPENASILTWMAYALDHLLGIILFDCPDIYGWKLTKIEHARTTWMSHLVFSFKLLVSLGLIKYLYEALKTGFTHKPLVKEVIPGATDPAKPS